MARDTSETTVINGKRYHIIPDGAICKESYEKAPFRVVHVLKEATNPEGLAEMLLQNIRGNGTVKWRLWKVTARRSYCLQHRLPEWSTLDDHGFGQAFRSSAVINLNDTYPVGKKGRSATCDKDMMQMARLRWEYRRKLLEQLNPSVVVCGGAFRRVRELLAECGNCTHHDDKKPFFLWNDIPFIYAYHPAFRKKAHACEYEEFRQRCLGAQTWIYADRTV